MAGLARSPFVLTEHISSIVNENYRHACKSHMCGTCVTCMHTNYCVLHVHASYLYMFKPHMFVILVMCSVSTNGERASLENSKLTIGSLLECSLSVKSLVDSYLNLGKS